MYMKEQIPHNEVYQEKCSFSVLSVTNLIRFSTKWKWEKSALINTRGRWCNSYGRYKLRHS
jgi:hypothetical protein